MKSAIWLLRLVLAAAGLVFLGRLIFRFVSTGREALVYSSSAYYDPTVFVVVGLLLLPAVLLGLRYMVRFIRSANRRSAERPKT